MKRETFEMVKSILTTHQCWANGTDYSLSLQELVFDDFEYYRIECYPNGTTKSFHDGFASFFCNVAQICNCSCSFRAVNDTCVCYFY